MKGSDFFVQVMKIETHTDSEKQAQILKLLQFGTVMVFVDSRQAGVIVPEYLKGDYQLRLNFDYAYEVDDFRILPDRLEASLSFNRKNHFCVVPYNAVYLMISHSIQHGILFTQSIPMEMLEYFATEARKEGQTAQVKNGPALSVIAGESPSRAESASDNVVADSAKSAKTTRKANHLRVVK